MSILWLLCIAFFSALAFTYVAGLFVGAHRAGQNPGGSMAIGLAIGVTTSQNFLTCILLVEFGVLGWLAYGYLVDRIQQSKK